MVNIIPAAIQGTGGWGSSAPMGEDINQRIAEALMLQTFKPQEIKSPWQGAAEMSNAALAGLMYRRALDNQMSGYKTLGSIYGGAPMAPTPQSSSGAGLGGFLSHLFGGGSSAPSAPPVAEAAPRPPATVPPPMAQLSDGSSVPLPPPNPLDGLNPQFRQQFADLRNAAAERGVNFDAPPPGSIGGVRTQDQQNALYAQGRTAPGPIVTGTRNSNHIKGRALDVVPVDGTTEKQVGQTVADLVRNDPRFAGMRSGATFSNLYDPLHVELNKPGIAVAQAPAQSPQGSVLQYASLGNPIQGRGSWFGDAPGFRDPMNGSATASGVPTSQPGIALPNRSTLGQLYQVTAPNGRTAVVPQTDVGPGARTGRAIDVAAGAVPALGYGPNNFPTDAPFTAQPVVPLPPQRPQQIASNDPNFMPGAQPSFGAPMGNGIPPVGGPTDPFPTAPMAQNAPQVPLPPPRPMMSPSTPPPGQMLNGQPWNFPAMTPMPPDVRGTPVPPPPPPPQNPQGVPANMAQAPVQLAQNGPGLPQGAMLAQSGGPPPMPGQGMPPQIQQPQQAANPMIGYLQGIQQRANAALQMARTPQQAQAALQALQWSTQQLYALQAPQPMTVKPGEAQGMRVLGQDGQYHFVPMAGTDVNGQGTPNEAEITYMARRANTGDQTVFSNSRGELGQYVNNLVKKRAAEIAMAEGISPEDMALRQGDYQGYVSGQKNLGTRVAQTHLISNEAKGLIDQALEASSENPRTQYMPINSIVQAYQKHTGDPSVIKLGAAIYGLAHLYARGVNPSGQMNESDVNHAYEILEPALSKGQLAAGIGQINRELTNIKSSAGSTQQEIHDQYKQGLMPGAQQAPQAPSGPASINSKAQYDALPSGTKYIAPDGSVRTKR